MLNASYLISLKIKQTCNVSTYTHADLKEKEKIIRRIHICLHHIGVNKICSTKLITKF